MARNDMVIPHLIRQISQSQDGNPISKFIGQYGDIAWTHFDDTDSLSVCDALNLLLLKIAVSQDRNDDIAYAIGQLERAQDAMHDVELFA